MEIDYYTFGNIIRFMKKLFLTIISGLVISAGSVDAGNVTSETYGTLSTTDSTRPAQK